MKLSKITQIEIEELIWEFGIRAVEFHSNKRTMEELIKDRIVCSELIQGEIEKELNNQGWVEA